VVCLLAVNIIKSDDPDFSNTPHEITMNQKYVSFQINTNVIVNT